MGLPLWSYSPSIRKTPVRMTRTFRVVPSDNSYVDQGSALASKSICSASTWRCVTGEMILTIRCDTFFRILSAPAKHRNGCATARRSCRETARLGPQVDFPSDRSLQRPRNRFVMSSTRDACVGALPDTFMAEPSACRLYGWEHRECRAWTDARGTRRLVHDPGSLECQVARGSGRRLGAGRSGGLLRKDRLRRSKTVRGFCFLRYERRVVELLWEPPFRIQARPRDPESLRAARSTGAHGVGVHAPDPARRALKTRAATVRIGSAGLISDNARSLFRLLGKGIWWAFAFALPPGGGRCHGIQVDWSDRFRRGVFVARLVGERRETGWHDLDDHVLERSLAVEQRKQRTRGDDRSGRDHRLHVALVDHVRYERLEDRVWRIPRLPGNTGQRDRLGTVGRRGRGRGHWVHGDPPLYFFGRLDQSAVHRRPIGSLRRYLPKRGHIEQLRELQGADHRHDPGGPSVDHLGRADRLHLVS